VICKVLLSDVLILNPSIVSHVCVASSVGS